MSGTNHHILTLVLIPLLANLVWAAEEAPGNDERNATLKVVTFNIMWEENGVRAGNRSLPVWADRRSRVGELITEANPDIVGLQEASPEQQAGLRTDLPRYAFVYDAVVNNTNPILFKTRRFRLVDSGAFTLNAVPEEAGTNIGVRRSTWVFLEDRRTERKLRVYNLHLDHRSKGPTRQISAVRLVERLAAESGLKIVTGDFNAPESSPTMKFFLGTTRLNNDMNVPYANPNPFTDAFRVVHPHQIPNLIDHVLTGPGLTVIGAERVRSGEASDHDIIAAEIGID